MPAPYNLDLFEAMQADGRIRARVLYMEMAAPDTRWGDVSLPDGSEVLNGGWTSVAGGRIHWNPGVLAAIRRSHPDLVVVTGDSSLTAQLVMRGIHDH